MEELFRGQQQELILLETVPQLQQKKAVLKFSIKIVVLPAHLWELKLIATGLHMAHVFKEKEQAIEPGLLFKQIIQLTVPQHLTKLMVQNIDMLHVAQLVVL